MSSSRYNMLLITSNCYNLICKRDLLVSQKIATPSLLYSIPIWKIGTPNENKSTKMLFFVIQTISFIFILFGMRWTTASTQLTWTVV